MFVQETILFDGARLNRTTRIEAEAGAKIPRKGGPGITRSDLLVINKIDLARFVGADLQIMKRDASKMRGEKPFYFTNLKENQGVEKIADFIVDSGGLDFEKTVVLH